MSDTPRTDRLYDVFIEDNQNDFLVHFCAMYENSRALERENTTLRNYLMTLASDGAKPGDAKTIWRKVRGEMV